jgi:ABC-2 type transport system ATP-binding protein
MIKISNLTKRFGGLTAVNNLSLEIGPGEVFGFIGPNGAGKSTTMKILACLMSPDEGEARVCGFDVRRDGDEIRRVLGYMPDTLGVYDDLTVDEYLQFFAGAFRVERGRRRSLIDSVLELTDLGEKKHAMVDSLSRGMQQRLGVARVLISEPKVLLLDEPASGLDPRARIEMRELLQELGRMGKCLMVSSHILSELAEMCTSIGIIERGTLMYGGSIEEAYRQAGIGEAKRWQVRLERGSEVALAVAALEREPRISRVKASGVGGRVIEIELVAPGVASDDAARGTSGEPHGSGHFVLERLMSAGPGVRIESFGPETIKLEDAFLKLTKGKVQ